MTWRHWKGCPLVNPLCPDDLCILPARHKGWLEGKHTLGTDRMDDLRKLDMEIFFLRVVGTAEEELVQDGARRQHELFPDPDFG